MADTDQTESAAPGAVEHTVLLSRISLELSSLSAMASDLQGALHNLPLEQSDTQTRKVLQSADKLTQSLDCLSATLAGLSDLPIAARDYDLGPVLVGVFLEDLRERLTHGCNSPALRDRSAPGDVDFF